MKLLNKIILGTVAITLAVACNDGIDPISAVEPGPDAAAPGVTLSYPLEGTLVRVREDVAPVTISFEATDDIEIKAVKILLDGTEITSFTDFIDYRRAVKSYTYPSLKNGNHVLTVTATDMSDKSTSKTVNFEKLAPYQPKFEGENFYMPFDGDWLELVSITDATLIGTPAFTDVAESGKAFAGATDAYLTLPTTGLLNGEFSAAFWYKLDASPDRSGILTISPPDPTPATAGKPNKRTNGFRFFREASGTNQTFKLNVGTGDGESWFDGGAAASIPASTTGWVHLAFTISATNVVVYINGEVVSQGSYPGVDWTDCDLLAIGSGAPRFIEWGHLSDISIYDELRIFNKAITKEEVQALMAD